MNDTIGARVTKSGAAFRVWAPKRRRVEVVIESPSRAITLEREGDGFFHGEAHGVGAGARYRFRLDGEDALYPDPASRFQPEGPHGPSEIVDPSRFAWTDEAWHGVGLRGQVFYEMHVGTFTPEGTWEAAQAKLPALVELGVTVIEMMPVADFSGRFGWGYDGVNLFAPTRLYGPPDALRRFVNAAHALGLGVILDVVYNHFGSDGNYVGAFADEYVSTKHGTDWGPALNYDGPGAGPVRAFVAGNAAYWIREYHFDGLRVDATQDVKDDSDEHVLALLCREARAAARGRDVLLVAENEPQDTRLLRSPEEGGYGFDAVWNDDFHHAAVVALTGHREAYYGDYRGTPQELLSAVKHGYLFQGQRSQWQDKRRGTPALDVDLHRFVTYVENHDQTANTARGERLRFKTHPGRHRALVALLLLSPSTPLLFQGEEFGSSAPFAYFADREEELAQMVKRGREKFLHQFPSIAAPEMAQAVPEPHAEETFRACKLDWSERARHGAVLALYRDLLTLRRADTVIARARRGGVDGAWLADRAFALRFQEPGTREARLVLVNLGADLELPTKAEPLLAPPTRAGWEVLWSSEDPRYGGGGTAPVDRAGALSLPGESAVVLKPAPEV